ncbi:SCO family protein [Brevundimonas balnearis]|uniref:SCO family protein n=1 Tax=Brevundimonas balnearis TaxID=1572858 RepID=A0ABV6R6B3_9CAUL
MPRGRILLFAAACIGVALALAMVTIIVVGGRSSESNAVVSTGQPDVGGPFQLVNQDGQAVDQSLLEGRWNLVFFGFTYCPDYCPTTLTALKATLDRLGPRGEDIQVVLVSVDPARDTPQALKDYLSNEAFPAGTVGLTGTEAQVAEAARAYRALYEKVGEDEYYTMNHTLTVYLMGPDGRFRQALSHDLGPERMAEVIQRAMSRG